MMHHYTIDDGDNRNFINKKCKNMKKLTRFNGSYYGRVFGLYFLSHVSEYGKLLLQPLTVVLGLPCCQYV